MNLPIMCYRDLKNGEDITKWCEMFPHLVEDIFCYYIRNCYSDIDHEKNLIIFKAFCINLNKVYAGLTTDIDNTPLTYACEIRHSTLIQALLIQGADPNFGSGMITPIMTLILGQSYRFTEPEYDTLVEGLIKLLIEYGLNIREEIFLTFDIKYNSKLIHYVYSVITG